MVNQMGTKKLTARISQERWRRFVDEQRDVLVVYAILLGIVLLAYIFLPDFRGAGNFLNVLRQSVSLGIASVGQTLVILVGGIDLSVGATISLTNVYSSGFI